MAFGKKKKQKAQEAQEVKEAPEQVKVHKVPAGENVLYPPKEESAIKEIGIAIGCVVGALVLIALIVQSQSFSMGNGMEKYQRRVEAKKEKEEVKAAAETEDEIRDEFERENEAENGADDETDEEQADQVIVIAEANFVEVNPVEANPVEADSAETNPVEIPEAVSLERVRSSTSDYVLEESDSRLIDDRELAGLTAEDLRCARNEIYARHGRLFKDSSIQNYFNSKEWYHGTIAPESFRESVLNEAEKKNIQKILSYEQGR